MLFEECQLLLLYVFLSVYSGTHEVVDQVTNFTFYVTVDDLGH